MLRDGCPHFLSGSTRNRTGIHMCGEHAGHRRQAVLRYGSASAWPPVRERGSPRGYQSEVSDRCRSGRFAAVAARARMGTVRSAPAAGTATDGHRMGVPRLDGRDRRTGMGTGLVYARCRTDPAQGVVQGRCRGRGDRPAGGRRVRGCGAACRRRRCGSTRGRISWTRRFQTAAARFGLQPDRSPCPMPRADSATSARPALSDRPGHLSGHHRFLEQIFTKTRAKNASRPGTVDITETGTVRRRAQTGPAGPVRVSAAGARTPTEERWLR